MGNMLVADQNGFRLGGSRGIVAGHQGVSMGGRVWGRRESEADPRGRGRGHRGRHSHRGSHHRRSVSTSSSSSSSSSSTSDSVSSVGSLPEYEDLRDQQLPRTRQALEDWLNHPDQPITKEEVRKMCQEINSSKHASPTLYQQDMTDLRKEVRELMKAFRESKKVQKRERKALKRERRSARKAARKQKRLLKKEDRHARREGKKCKDKGKVQGENFRPFSPFGIAHHFPAMNHATSIPAEPPLLPPSMMRGFPFGRTTSAPPGSCPPSPQWGREGPPGLSALHGTWPFTQGSPYAPGNISVPSFGEPTSVSRSAEQIHAELLKMACLADDREARAIELRVAVTIDGISHKAKLKMMSEATAMEEEAGKYRREADRLRAEGQLLDSELAKELDEENVRNVQQQQDGQISGVTNQ
jgi:hypothetical protein